MLHLAIIADDLTGALDAAAPFAGMDGGVAVATGPETLGAALAMSPGVVSVSTRSREVDAEEAGRRVARVLAALPESVRLFKKVDSRLKGNIASEVAVFGDRPLLVAPAIPEFGRIVRNGQLQGFGIDIPLSVRSRLGAAAERATVPDTATAEDMRHALRNANAGTVLVGARGLASAIAASLGIASPPRPGLLPGPICLAVGSTDPITLAQVGQLVGVADVVHVRAPAGRVPDAPAGGTSPVTLLQIVGAPHGDQKEVSRSFATGAAPWLAQSGTIILTGGATAEACLDALGTDVLRVTGEILPGLPLSVGGGRTIVTKSGGFGEADCLLRLVGGTIAVEA